MTPLVSILIPACNSERWIGETIRSALDQNWPNKEIIVVDDGSSDETRSVAAQFESSGVRIISQPNSGAAAARNRALGLSRGDFIQWLDADDLLAPDKIKRQLESIKGPEDNRVLWSGAWGRFMYRPRKARFTPTLLWCDLTPRDWLRRKLGGSLFMQPATWLVSRSLTEAAGPWDTRLSLDDDGEYFCRVVKACERVRFVRESKVYYRTGFPSLSDVGRSRKKLSSQLLAIRSQISALRSLDRNAESIAACVSYLQSWLPFFEPHQPDLADQLRGLAAELGGTLQAPVLPFPYQVAEKALGPLGARQCRSWYNYVKRFCVRSWDKALFHLERRATIGKN